MSKKPHLCYGKAVWTCPRWVMLLCDSSKLFLMKNTAFSDCRARSTLLAASGLSCDR